MKHEDILSMAKQIVFPAWDTSLKTVSPDSAIDEISERRCPQCGPVHHLFAGGETYLGVPANDHHYTTGYHYRYVIPVVLDLFGIKWDRDEYELVPYFLKYKAAPDPEKYYDFSYLKYRKPQSFYLYDHMCRRGKRMDTLFREWNDFDCVHDRVFGYTEYQLFLYCAHSVATITNLNNPNGRHLAVSCDSQMIPAIPILINYFGKITMFDHRFDVDIRNVWRNERYDDVLIAHWSENSYAEYRFEQKMWRNFGIEP